MVMARLWTDDVFRAHSYALLGVPNLANIHGRRAHGILISTLLDLQAYNWLHCELDQQSHISCRFVVFLVFCFLTQNEVHHLQE